MVVSRWSLANTDPELSRVQPFSGKFRVDIPVKCRDSPHLTTAPEHRFRESPQMAAHDSFASSGPSRASRRGKYSSESPMGTGGPHGHEPTGAGRHPDGDRPVLGDIDRRRGRALLRPDLRFAVASEAVRAIPTPGRRSSAPSARVPTPTTVSCTSIRSVGSRKLLRSRSGARSQSRASTSTCTRPSMPSLPTTSASRCGDPS